MADFPKVRILPNGLIVDNHPLRAPFFSIWNKWPHLRGRSLVIGFIGPRGSGKGTSSARTLNLNYLMIGRKVWSRVNVGVDLVTPTGITPLRSIPIDSSFNLKDCYNGVLFMDEVNEDGADAYRSQSTEALELSYDIQELRKSDSGGLSKMDFIWTTQSETMCNPRLRFQTDIIIKCADYSLTNRKVGIGEYSRWEIWDYSGIVTGKNTTVKLPPTPIIFTKPWWHSFNTGTRIRDMVRQEKANTEQELYDTARKIAEFIKENEKVRRLKVWREFNITDHKQQIAIQRILGGEFDIISDARREWFKVEDYASV